MYDMQIERKLTRVKELAVGKGKWPGRAGPHDAHLEEEAFQEYRREVVPCFVGFGHWQ